MKKIYCTFVIILLAFVRVAEPAPAVSNVAGTLRHDATATITGSGFGVKNPVAPLVWDAGTSNPSLSTYYDGWLPTQAQQGTTYNMAYRQVPFRGVSAPYNRISYILGGAHATNTEAGMYYGGNNVGIGKNITSHNYFISYYYRIDPLYDEHNNPTMGENMKEIVLSGVSGQFYTDIFPPGHGYLGQCNPPDVNNTAPMLLARVPINPVNQSAPYSCSGNNLVYHDNPINGWVQMQWDGHYNSTYDSPEIVLTTYPGNKKMYLSHYGDPITVAEYARGIYTGYPKLNDLKFIGIGGFARVPRMNNGINSFRYFSAVYIDSTRARVMLGDNPDYNSCTIMEPQIPAEWSSNRIVVRINLGRLPDSGIAYLYVVDADNNHNVRGFPITLGTAVTPDTLSPSKPLNPRAL